MEQQITQPDIVPGTIVTVLQPMKRYRSYSRWVERKAPRYFREYKVDMANAENKLYSNDTLIVLVRAPHDSEPHDLILCRSLNDDTLHLLAVEAVDKAQIQVPQVNVASRIQQELIDKLYPTIPIGTCQVIACELCDKFGIKSRDNR